MSSEEHLDQLSELVQIVHWVRHDFPSLTDEELAQEVARMMQWRIEDARWLVGFEREVYKGVQ